ncbi:hypothetical protein GX51_07870 [Blastomyces parvus]|uniref:Uncharacterized protein n=1 Tax=Blastomyces parvus TaxID=2060905 RepID=A0A2B7WIL1_9EURO|nr:hypothetical protein GX51_07870 [Blastomyces parvus]
MQRDNEVMEHNHGDVGSICGCKRESMGLRVFWANRAVDMVLRGKIDDVTQSCEVNGRQTRTGDGRADAANGRGPDAPAYPLLIVNGRTKASCTKLMSTWQKGPSLRWDSIADLTLKSMLQLP